MINIPELLTPVGIMGLEAMRAWTMFIWEIYPLW